MSPSTPSAPAETPAQAFVRVGFPKLLAKLYRYATGRLHLAGVDAERAGVFEAADLVNTLVVRGLSGDLKWPLGEDATEAQVAAYACKKLYGMRSTFGRKNGHTLGDDDALDALADESPDALELLVEQRGLADLLRAFEHDDEASAHLSEMLTGKTRAEIVDALGCTEERANAVRRRIVRGVTALSARMNDDSEAEPPSSGPRGRYHELQATEERPGAPPEPHRGAGGARRWR
jgi:hypothetical protein